MELKIAIYTYDAWFYQDVIEALTYIRKTRGLTSVEYDVITIPKLGRPDIESDKKGKFRLDFDWLFDTVFEGDYNVHALVLPKSERSRLGSHSRYNGYYNTNTGDNSMEFVMFVDEGEQARHYDFSEFTRLFLHELAHGFDHWTNGKPNTVTHDYDYNLKAIHKIFEKEFTFGRWNLIKQIAELYTRLKGKKTLLSVAKDSLGKDASPKNLADNELGCAESVSTLISKIVPDFRVVTGTWTLWNALENSPRFKEVTNPMPGDIIISPTGTVVAPFPGHTGILGDNGSIMSNDSEDGKWRENYTLASWINKWGAAGYPVYYYRLLA